MPFDHHLGDAISNRRDPQRAHPAIALRYVDPPHRWRKVAARRQTIPKFIEVVFKISLKIRNHLAVYASRPLVGSDPLIGFPHLREPWAYRGPFTVSEFASYGGSEL